MPKQEATVVVCCSIAVSLTVLVVVGKWYHTHMIQRISKQWEDRRNEERKGRIRAEVKLRTLLKQQQQQQQQQLQQVQEQDVDVDKQNGTTSNNKQQQQNHSMLLKCIGTVVSPYTKRVGTPRQGALVPSSRGYIDVSSIPPELLVGIQEYSHIWIIFGFHANTDLITSTKTKIRPPRAPPGMKVGQLSTRSPHRPNPLGLSLVKLQRFDTTTRHLHISGLDLVNGTPVYDIKPFVPWDIPGYYDISSNNNSDTHKSDNSNNADGATNVDSNNEAAVPFGLTNTTMTTITNMSQLRFTVPSWVGQDDDELCHVSFTPHAMIQLQQVVQEGRLAPLYNNDSGGLDAARQTLEQVLAQDPRSSHKGLKTVQNQRGSILPSKSATTTTTTTTASNSTSSSSSPNTTTKVTTTAPAASTTPFRLYFGSTGVDFVVIESGVQVLGVVPVDFPPDAYMDGIPLASLLTETTTTTTR